MSKLGYRFRDRRPLSRDVYIEALVVAGALLLVLGIWLIAARRVESIDANAASALPLSPIPLLASVPRPNHVVIVMEENHSYSEIIGNANAPYINSLASQGALFTNSHGVTHPSQPNYLYLFSGSPQTTIADECPPVGVPWATANLGQELIASGYGFTGYSEDLPSVGSTTCHSGQYYRKHNPWVNFGNIPTVSNQPYTSYPADLSTLPTVSFVIPNQDHDMHDGTIAQADTWLKAQIDVYKQWTMTHNCLLIVTWDEDDSSSDNLIPTIFYGPMVMPGQYSETINHLNVLRTLEDMYGLRYVGQSGNANPITDIWKDVVATSTPTPDPETATPTIVSTATAAATATQTTTSGTTSTATTVPTATGTRTSTPQQTAIRTATAIPSATGQSLTSTPVPTSTATTIVSTQTATAPATSTATQCAIEFTDVPPDSTFYLYVRCLACRGILGGYTDGTFRPGNNVTRAQLAKIVARSAGFSDPHDTQTFEDVPTTDTFYLYVEQMSSRGIIGGYSCGILPLEPCVPPDNRPYFRPTHDATRGQISKIVALSAGYNDPAGDQLFEDVPTDSAFFLYVQQLANRSILGGYDCGGVGEPCNPPDNRPYFRPGSKATRGQTAKIVSNTFFPGCQP